MFLVLAAQFESFKLPFGIMTTAARAWPARRRACGRTGSRSTSTARSPSSCWIGLAAKNGVLIVEFANQLRDRGVEFMDAIIEASTTRLRPVLMTSLCSAFGAIPLLLAVVRGAESGKPIGAVVLYGVLISMVPTLIVVPAVYTLVARNSCPPPLLDASHREDVREAARARRRTRAAQPPSTAEAGHGARSGPRPSGLTAYELTDDPTGSRQDR